jgi:AcrR family transcriptional regulator
VAAAKKGGARKKRAPKKDARRGAEGTGEHILQTALRLFRKKGFDATTMRDIAGTADMSLGAAYYYFASKEALVLAYYERVVADRVSRADALFDETDDLRERIAGLYQLHFDEVSRDRKLLGALVRSVADPDSSLSVFAPATRSVRNETIDLFYRALDVEDVPEHLRDLGALGLWTLDLGLMLYFVWDDSPGQRRTRRLVENAVDMIMPLIPLLGLPLAEPMIQQAARMLLEADLVPADEGDG